MKKTSSVIFLLLSISGGSFAACSVDTDGLRFDDDAYDEAKNGDGDGGQGGTTSSGDGDQGGSTGDGDGDGGDPGTTGDVEPECTMTGELVCNDKQVQICTGEFFIDAGPACEFVCSDGACTGICKPGKSECVSETEQRSCDEAGQWGEASQCKNVCTDDACGGACKPGDRSCDGEDATLKRVCNALGEWEPDGNCSVGECSDGACTSCTGDETQCTPDSRAMQSCEDGSFGEPDECEDQVCLGGSCTGECRPALGGDEPQRRCAAGSPSTQLQTCGADGNFGAASACNFVCVPGSNPGKNDACGGVCKPGEQRCDGSILLACSSDGLKEEKVEDCSEKGLSCLDVGGGKLGCGECTPGNKDKPNNRCAQRVAQTCEGGKWVDVRDCAKDTPPKFQVSICYDGECTTGTDACKRSREAAFGCYDADNKWVCNDGADTDGTDLKSCLLRGSCTLTSCATSLVLPPRL